MLRVCAKCGALLDGSEEDYQLYKFFKDDPSNDIMNHTILDLCQHCGNKYWSIEEFISDEFKELGNKCLEQEYNYFKNNPTCIFCKNEQECKKMGKDCIKRGEFELSETALFDYLWNSDLVDTERHPLLKSFYKSYMKEKGHEVKNK